MSTVVMSVYKVASFPDGGGHFWVYLQYALGLRRLGCEVYWLEQLRPARDPERGAAMLSTFMERMKRFDGRYGGDAGGALPRLRPAVDPHPATRLPRPLAIHA